MMIGKRFLINSIFQTDKIMNRIILVLTVASLISSFAIAQPGWNFPDNEQDSLITSEKLALYGDPMKAGDFKQALAPLQWLLINVPDLNESIYINGAKIFESLVDITNDPAQKRIYKDSAMLMYDLRIQYFNDEAAVMNRKSYTGYGFFKDDPAKYKELYDMYSRTFSLDKKEIWDQNLLAYMDVVRRYRLNGGDIPDEKVLEIYDQIIEIVDDKKEQGEEEEKLEKLRDNVYRLLANIINVDCEFIQNKLGPALLENPDDLGLAKNIFRFAFAGKCMEIPIFLEAVRIIFDKEPNYGMARLIADRSYVNKDFETALDFYEKAMELTDENVKISELYLNQANINSIRGNKSKARELAFKALNVDPANRDAYNTIGNLYYNSYQECKKGINEVEDRAVFFAAYEMYRKAGNTEGMKQAKEQFPLMETIHTYNMIPGDPVRIGCWINESYTVQRRD
jgi:tetratricopeptide (TPR) repeat protein